MSHMLEQKLIVGSSLESILTHAHNSAVEKYHDASRISVKVVSIKTASSGVGGVALVVEIEIHAE